MTRFFRSALFPLIVIVLLVYLASQTLIPQQKSAKKVTYSELIQRVQDDGVKIDWLIPHQANLTRILLPACAKTGIDPDRLCASFAETGNTSSASIPILLDQLIESGRARPGEHALMVGFGASFSIGSALIRFDERVARG